MKKHLAVSLFILTLFVPVAATALPKGNPEMTTIAAESDVKVYYSFDHHASNNKVIRTFVSGDMLRAAEGTKLFQSTAWDISSVVSRLTSLLSLHTHSVSTTKVFHKDLESVRAKKAYECLMQAESGDTKFIVFAHRSRGKQNLDEIIIFKFRSTYCTRVIQMTGKLRTTDIATIIRSAK